MTNNYQLIGILKFKYLFDIGIYWIFVIESVGGGDLSLDGQDATLLAKWANITNCSTLNIHERKT